MLEKLDNPLKMWGSYVGALIGFLSVTLFMKPEPSGILLLTTVILIFAGFYIGWGIHSLVRWGL